MNSAKHRQGSTDGTRRVVHGTSQPAGSALPDGCTLEMGGDGRWRFNPETIPLTRENVMAYISRVAEELHAMADAPPMGYVPIPDDILRLMEPNAKDEG